MTSQPSATSPILSHHQVLHVKSRKGRDQKVSAPISSAGLARSVKSAQPGVLARIQALLPSPFTFPQSPVAPTGPSFIGNTPPQEPLFLKARIITWNMHDSLPKGDLEELLGSVPLYTPRDILDDADRLRIPGLSMEDTHPYHIIVVAGQECPTMSGIPLGLAANFKHKDVKDREKEKEKHKEKETEEDEGKDKDLLHQTKHMLSKHLKHEHTPLARLPGSSREDLRPDAHSHSPLTAPGWSAVLEDWFANRVGSIHADNPTAPIGAMQSPSNHESSLPLADEEQTDRVSGPETPACANSPPISTTNARFGPYELLVKERLMGIYTAVYIHRDVRSLVRGFSTGAVPAGLIGGRLGNKGGVGVSVNLYGTTFLFINAHLAAHEGKVLLRAANLAKIKAELPLESWLPPDNPRTLAEDLTDRFDHSWIFGDLNFRLDISRLHADWLISRKEYSQALAFDQLHKLMNGDQSPFVGFTEATIDFPPTFKYDVMHTLKRGKSKLHGTDQHFGADSEEEDDSQTNDHGDDGDDERQGGAASLHSSHRSSNHSRLHPGPAEDENDGDPSPPNFWRELGPLRRHSRKLVTRAALKAKAAWTALLEPSRDSSPTTDSPKSRKRTSAAPLRSPGSLTELSRGTKVNSEAHTSATLLRRVVSVQTPLEQQDHGQQYDLFDDDKGVYDSSSKKRVPSWCDRILWKSTVQQADDTSCPNLAAVPETESLRSAKRPNRVGQLLTQALRPRAQRDSVDPKALLSAPPELYKSNSLETSHLDGSLSKYPVGLGRSTSATAAKDGSLRRQSMPVSSSVLHRPHPRRAESDQSTLITSQTPSAMSSTSPSTPVSRVVFTRWFLNLIFRDNTPSSGRITSGTTPQPSIPSHRKGDVVCLTYRTLDDRQMRRLEGRSDHRPVIGAFAVYI